MSDVAHAMESAATEAALAWAPLDPEPVRVDLGDVVHALMRMRSGFALALMWRFLIALERQSPHATGLER